MGRIHKKVLEEKEMKFYFAPMEGITIYLYRNAYEEFFGEIDKYFTPFIMPNGKRMFRSRELQDVLPENNEGIYLVPQILTKKSDEFIKVARELKEMGYNEVNLNVGCPSKTVVSKGKGSGFLKDLEELDHFLEDVFDALDMKISIKTRIGVMETEEFEEILEVYNRYPLSELIVHPRLQKEFYTGTPHMECFRMAVEESRNPLCYNGDLVTKEDYENLIKEFPKLEQVMMGRGFLRNPALTAFIKRGEGLSKSRFREFHDKIYAAYRETLSGEKNVLFKMKDFWSNPVQIFTDYEKYAKKIRKAQNLINYEKAVNALFLDQDIQEEMSTGKSILPLEQP